MDVLRGLANSFVGTVSSAWHAFLDSVVAFLMAVFGGI